MGYIPYNEDRLMDFTVEFYEMEDGRQPAREFLLSLDKGITDKMRSARLA